MLDDRETTQGDLVHDGNIAQWKQKFCDDSGHSMECVDETIIDMANLLAKTCISFGGIPPEEIIDKMNIECFDEHIRAILNSKDCSCND